MGLCRRGRPFVRFLFPVTSGSNHVDPPKNTFYLHVFAETIAPNRPFTTPLRNGSKELPCPIRYATNTVERAKWFAQFN
jgi:hypothetical protein